MNVVGPKDLEHTRANEIVNEGLRRGGNAVSDFECSKVKCQEEDGGYGVGHQKLIRKKTEKKITILTKDKKIRKKNQITFVLKTQRTKERTQN